MFSQPFIYTSYWNIDAYSVRLKCIAWVYKSFAYMCDINSSLNSVLTWNKCRIGPGNRFPYVTGRLAFQKGGGLSICPDLTLYSSGNHVNTSNNAAHFKSSLVSLSPSLLKHKIAGYLTYFFTSVGVKWSHLIIFQAYYCKEDSFVNWYCIYLFSNCFVCLFLTKNVQGYRFRDM